MLLSVDAATILFLHLFTPDQTSTSWNWHKPSLSLLDEAEKVKEVCVLIYIFLLATWISLLILFFNPLTTHYFRRLDHRIHSIFNKNQQNDLHLFVLKEKDLPTSNPKGWYEMKDISLISAKFKQ